MIRPPKTHIRKGHLYQLFDRYITKQVGSKPDEHYDLLTHHNLFNIGRSSLARMNNSRAAIEYLLVNKFIGMFSSYIGNDKHAVLCSYYFKNDEVYVMVVNSGFGTSNHTSVNNDELHNLWQCYKITDEKMRLILTFVDEVNNMGFNFNGHKAMGIWQFAQLYKEVYPKKEEYPEQERMEEDRLKMNEILDLRYKLSLNVSLKPYYPYMKHLDYLQEVNFEKLLHLPSSLEELPHLPSSLEGVWGANTTMLKSIHQLKHLDTAQYKEIVASHLSRVCTYIREVECYFDILYKLFGTAQPADVGPADVGLADSCQITTSVFFKASVKDGTTDRFEEKAQSFVKLWEEYALVQETMWKTRQWKTLQWKTRQLFMRAGIYIHKAKCPGRVLGSV